MNRQAKELKHLASGGSALAFPKTTEDPKVHKLIDCPPYPCIRYTSHGFEAFRQPEEENVKNYTAKSSPWHTSGSINEDKVEDINAEAEAFIKWKHHKFELAKLMSSKTFY